MSLIKDKELSADKVRKAADTGALGFRTTKGLAPLAGLVGQQAAIERRWADYEQSYADSSGGWGAPDAISSRVPEWEAEAQALILAIEAYCSAE